MAQTLSGKTVAALATDGVEQVELTKPMQALRDAGATVHLVSPNSGQIQGFNHLTPGDKFPVDKSLSETDASAYDALLLPGGVANPDQLRGDDDAVAFVRAFFDAGKPVAAICHAPWLLVETGIAKGRKMTSYKSIRTDVINAGATWEDSEVVVDDGVITSRNPGDLGAFVTKIVEEVKEGKHQRRAA